MDSLRSYNLRMKPIARRWRLIAGLAALLAGCDRADSPPAAASPSSAARKLGWDVFSSYEYRPRMEFPKAVTELHGQRIEIAGYLFPTRQTRDIREFILMRDPGTCCYGPQAQYNHFMHVRVVRGPGVHFTRDPVTVVGRFILNEKIDGDYIDGIYELEAEEHRR